MKVPEPRIRDALDRTVRPERTWILYWMTSARRPTYNFALQRAVELAKELNKPLLVFEAVRAAYGHASDRLHRFLLQGMADNHDAFAGRGVGYLPYVEPEPDAGKGLLRALGSRACAVVTDDHPGFFLPKMLEAASNQLDVRMEAVDSNGVLPIERERAYLRAVDFRRHVQRTLPTAFVLPAPDPLEGVQLPPAPVLDEALLHRWPPATASSLREGDLSSLPIDHTVGPVGMRGGAAAARDRLERFVAERLDRYAAESNHPDARATSGLAPYLHFGHIATHEVFDAVAHRERWSMDRVADRAAGQRAGWWGMSEAAERFVDQLVTWRELGFSTAARRPDHREFGSLPPWARQTLADHVGDPRAHRYALETLSRAQTHDAIWNAAQRQLVRDGTIHGYLRMLWGKKILKWSPTPEEALATMIGLNDRYALDGRDPNSVSGIFWVLGRYDRPWGPERPIFGKVRYMTSANTARKLRLTSYLARYGPAPGLDEGAPIGHRKGS